METINIKTEEQEKYILAAVAVRDEDNCMASLDELSELLDTAGGVTVGKVVQNLPHPDPATYVGSGKAQELGDEVHALEADGIICDDELTAVQMKNLSDLAGCKVLDRTMLILDIFAKHAVTKEGKVQVEMAQLRYRLAHLRGIGNALSRLGGGIGTRGPGETKLETDRRAIDRRISTLSAQIKQLKSVRETTRKSRQKSAMPTFAIVGYTNAGKSTLLNRLTNSDILAEDKLFATLDPTTRICRMKDGREILLTDTVGFINKLPHNLIDAFRSTLEEAKYADYIMHVIDVSDENEDEHTRTVYRTLSELKIDGKPIITVFNKTDKADPDRMYRDARADKTVRISAKNGDGIDDLFDAITELLNETGTYVDTVIPYAEASKIAVIRKNGQLISEEYTPEGIHITAYYPDVIKWVSEEYNGDQTTI